MDYNDVKELIQIIDNSKFVNFELTLDNVSVKMTKSNDETSKNEEKPFVKDNVEKVKKIVEVEKNQLSDDEKPQPRGNIVKSPIVGTFYSAMSPDKPVLAPKGAKVKKGDVLCIVEAMKIMNEITSEFDGEVEEVFAENGQLVEYGEPLFSII